MHIASLLPFVFALFDFLFDPSFSSNIQRIEFRTGRWALIFLILSLIGTPLYQILRIKQGTVIRKTLGRYGFFYALLHVLAFLVLDYAFNLRLIWLTMGDTLYLVLGFVAFLILLAMMITSNPESMAFLKNYWKALHRFVYLTVALVIVHYILIEKSDISWPITASFIVGFLLLIRIPFIRDWLSIKKKTKKVRISTNTKPRKRSESTS
jgi:sulfoxide reductase heme-binding subunit YedZ